LQDRMADKLLVTRGLTRFLRGELSVEAFGNNLAREWASFPCLSPQTRGALALKRGQSYYDKFAGNSALISPETVEATLRVLRAAPVDAPLPPAEVPTPTPAAKPTPPVQDSVPFYIGVVVIVAVILFALSFFFWPR